ncbi:5-formyltetrahydrofolate cyclo-ligase [Frigidibacter sp. MR17.24]|uniref:5-formyltetrahydrofolate cyclo-ligase n=1 Tax=Frigidibacter sp. MR17.24 TaxID=3127345 RepID=UPI003012B9D3
MTDLIEAKAATRRAAFAARKAAHAAAAGEPAERACARLYSVLAPCAGQVAAGYMPIRTEIDPRPAMAAHLARGAGTRVAVPVIEGEGRPLLFRDWRPEVAMVPGDFGALIPETGDWLLPTVLIVPMLAFDWRGYRLGYGGGFYDRTLEGLRARMPVIAIGFAYAAQEVEEVPVEATDQPLDLIVTEAGVIRPGG